MNYEDFKEKFEEAVKDKLNDEGLEANLSFHEVKKLNESYEALTVTPEGESIGVNIPVERFFNAYEDGMDFSETIDKAVDI